MELDFIDDNIALMNGMLKAAKRQKENLERYNEEVANIMEKLKTDIVKGQLAEITQSNYAKMLEVEIDIAEIEKGLKEIKGLRLMLYGEIKG